MSSAGRGREVGGLCVCEGGGGGEGAVFQYYIMYMNILKRSLLCSFLFPDDLSSEFILGILKAFRLGGKY